MSLIVKITRNDKQNPPGKLTDAELHFIDGDLDGLKLLGFSVWERRSGTGRSVTKGRSIERFAWEGAGTSAAPSDEIDTDNAIVRRALNRLNLEERLVCVWKGFISRIARLRAT